MVFTTNVFYLSHLVPFGKNQNISHNICYYINNEHCTRAVGGHLWSHTAVAGSLIECRIDFTHFDGSSGIDR